MVAKSTRANEKVSEQRLKRRGEATVYLPPSFSLAGERGVNDGEKEGGLERRIGKMRVFIGSRGANISTLGTIARLEMWAGNQFRSD